MENAALLLNIGNELLDGRTLNSNAQYFGEQLRLRGAAIGRVITVSDNLGDIADALEEAKKFKVVLVTGGLGPTNDDRTAEAVATTFARPLKEHKKALQHVSSSYRTRGLPLTANRRKLASLPEGASLIPNKYGTAPGFSIQEGSCTFYFLPGVPSECRPVFKELLLPKIARSLAQKKCIERHFWRTFGKGESTVYSLIEKYTRPLEKKYPHSFQLGVHITFPCIDLTVESWRVPGKKSPSKAEIKRLKMQIDRAVEKITFTTENKTLPEVVVALLKKHKITLATAESCTGGLVGKVLTDISGSSEVYLGGVISYANTAKETLLKVKRNTIRSFGAVSKETVLEMASGARQILGAQYGVALSGISGPTGGTKNKPVGTIYVSVVSPHGAQTTHQVILSSKGSRDQNRIIAMHLALDALRTQILMKRRNERR